MPVRASRPPRVREAMPAVQFVPSGGIGDTPDSATGVPQQVIQVARQSSDDDWEYGAQRRRHRLSRYTIIRHAPARSRPPRGKICQRDLLRCLMSPILLVISMGYTAKPAAPGRPPRCAETQKRPRGAGPFGRRRPPVDAVGQRGPASGTRAVARLSSPSSWAPAPALGAPRSNQLPVRSPTTPGEVSTSIPLPNQLSYVRSTPLPP